MLLILNNCWHYDNILLQVDVLTHESVLLVHKVEQADFGQYQCTAQNEIGFSTNSVELDITSKPDPPTNLNVNDTTHNSITLSWTPGFDGGLSTTFRIRYKPSGSANEAYQYADVTPSNATTYVVRNLDLATEYVFSAMALNKRGPSDYAGHLKAHTTSKYDENTKNQICPQVIKLFFLWLWTNLMSVKELLHYLLSCNSEIETWFSIVVIKPLDF